MKISICGAGTMGRGIALSCIQAGLETILFDVQESALPVAEQYIISQLQTAVAKGKLQESQYETAKNLIRFSTSLEDMIGSDFVIEAIVENRDVKVDFFKEVEALCLNSNTILASNTSSISINSIASKLTKPEMFVGLHFFNPAHIMKLVEIIRGVRTSDEVVQRCIALCKQLGKTAAVAKDVPGFIVNRVARNYYNESQRIATEGCSDPSQIDRIMKSAGFKMGPFELMDLIGVDVNLDVTKSVWNQYFNEPRFEPSLLQQQTVDAGLHGKKTKQGFYKYDDK